MAHRLFRAKPLPEPIWYIVNKIFTNKLQWKLNKLLFNKINVHMLFAKRWSFSLGLNNEMCIDYMIILQSLLIGILTIMKRFMTYMYILSKEYIVQCGLLARTSETKIKNIHICICVCAVCNRLKDMIFKLWHRIYFSIMQIAVITIIVLGPFYMQKCAVVKLVWYVSPNKDQSSLRKFVTAS